MKTIFKNLLKSNLLDKKINPLLKYIHLNTIKIIHIFYKDHNHTENTGILSFLKFIIIKTTPLLSYPEVWLNPVNPLRHPFKLFAPSQAHLKIKSSPVIFIAFS